MFYYIYSLDDSLIYEISESCLRLYFKNASLISYSPYAAAEYVTCLSNDITGLIPIHELPWIPSHWNTLMIRAYEYSFPLTDSLTVNRILFEIIRADPLRYPCKNENFLDDMAWYIKYAIELPSKSSPKTCLLPETPLVPFSTTRIRYLLCFLCKSLCSSVKIFI